MAKLEPKYSGIFTGQIVVAPALLLLAQHPVSVCVSVTSRHYHANDWTD